MKTFARLTVAVLITLLLTEALLRGYRAAIGQIPPHEDPSVAAEWDWAKEHLEAGTADFSMAVSHDPDLGWVTQPRVRSAHGEVRKVRRRRTAGIPRVVLVGDSFTRELGNLGEAFQPSWQVFNLAVQGFGSGQAWLRYRKSGARLRGDVAVFGLYLRDYFRTFRTFRGYAKPTFSLGPEGEPSVENTPVPSPQALYDAYRTGERQIGRPGRSFLFDTISERRTLWARHHQALREDQFATFTAILAAFQRDALESGACPVLLIFPTRPDKYEGTVYETIDRRTREFATAAGLPTIALAEDLYQGASREERDRIFDSGRGAHMSDHGRSEVIRVLNEFFEEQAPADCPGEPEGPSEGV